MLAGSRVEEVVINSNLTIAASDFAQLLQDIDQAADSGLAGAGVITVTGIPEDLGSDVIDLAKLASFERGGVQAPPWRHWRQHH